MAVNGVAAYRWEDPGGSIVVEVCLDVVDRLNAAVQQGLELGLRRAEIGGILLGSMSGERKVLIEDFSLVPSEHLRGSSYTLSPGERQSLGRALAHHKPGEVVGFFRSHARQGLYLDQDDSAIFSRYFPEPSQVFLVVRPATDGPPMGGFFFWEDGDIDRRSPYRTFPFDSRRLLAGDFPITHPPAATLAMPAVRHRVPQVPWVTVPAIAGLFIIAGLFEYPHHTGQTTAVSETASAPDAGRLPRADTAAATATTVSPDAEQAQKLVEAPVPAPETLAEAAPPTAPASPPPEPKRLPAAPAPAPVKAARSSPPEFAAPPALPVPIRKQAELAAVLPPRALYPPPLPEAEVSYTAPHASVFRRVLHKVSPFGDAEADAFVPPTPLRKVTPALPPEAAAPSPEVDVKVYIDESGNVSRAQLLTKRTDLADPTLSAARQWQFAPARKRDKPVSSEMVLHFRFSALTVD